MAKLSELDVLVTFPPNGVNAAHIVTHIGWTRVELVKENDQYKLRDGEIAICTQSPSPQQHKDLVSLSLYTCPGANPASVEYHLPTNAMQLEDGGGKAA